MTLNFRNSLRSQPVRVVRASPLLARSPLGALCGAGDSVLTPRSLGLEVGSWEPTAGTVLERRCCCCIGCSCGQSSAARLLDMRALFPTLSWCHRSGVVPWEGSCAQLHLMMTIPQRQPGAQRATQTLVGCSEEIIPLSTSTAAPCLPSRPATHSLSEPPARPSLSLSLLIHTHARTHTHTHTFSLRPRESRLGRSRAPDTEAGVESKSSAAFFPTPLFFSPHPPSHNTIIPVYTV